MPDQINIFVLTRLLVETQPRKLLDSIHDQIRLKPYSYRIDQTCAHSIRRYILFRPKRHLAEISSAELEVLLSHVTVVDKIAASTQNKALNAVVFLLID